LIVKPDVLGSSIGISVAKNEDELSEAREVCFLMGTKPLIEQALEDFCEYNIAVFKNSENKLVLSEIEKPVKDDEILSFNDKYIGGSMGAGRQRELPAEIDEKLKVQIEDLAEKAYTAFDLSGVVRIDFLFCNKQQKLFVNELNTIPGSLAFYLYKNSRSFTVLIDELILAAVAEEKAKPKEFTFESTILAEYKRNVNQNKFSK